MPSDKSTPDPKIIRMLREYRASLIAREDEQVKRLAAQWIDIENSLLDEMQLLALQIIEAKESGKAITEQLIMRMDRYQRLNAQMKSRILEFTKETAAPDIESEQREYGGAAIDIANDVIRSQFRLAPAFDTLPLEHVETYVGLLGNGAPLNTLLKEAYPDSLDGVIKALLEGTAKGLNPGQIATNAAKGLGMGLERITLIARTEQLRVNRLVSADQYRRSGLQGVMKRVATKDDRVCMACLVSDGEIIPLDQELDDHPRGRCCAIFQIKGVKEIEWQKGPDWFNKQSDDMQKSMMGEDKWEAWKAGKFKLSDLRQNSYSDIWGQSPRVPSLKELLGGNFVVESKKKKLSNNIEEMKKRLSKRFDFPENKIILTDKEGYKFDVGDLHTQSGAVFDPNTGTITVFDIQDYEDKEDLLAEILAHEVSHSKFIPFLGEITNEEMLVLAETDGYTDYSKAYWKLVDPSSPTARFYLLRAVDETLAEIARRETIDYLKPLKLSDEWKDLFRRVHGREYK